MPLYKIENVLVKPSLETKTWVYGHLYMRWT